MTINHNKSISSIDFSRSAAARYVQLASLFRRRVESGQWPVGEQIPTVDDLSEECNVARATVRQALNLLEAENLIARYRA
ncbi:MAG TPA: GntR family transcriptional regulator, partial [Eoetvoesiella sp.]